MTGLRYHLPPDRAVIAVAGEDRQPFLQGLISNDTAKITAERASYATLLTAQGRFLFDLFIAEQDGRYLVDCAAPRRTDLVKRLSMYRLRSKVTIADAETDWCVVLLFGDGAGAAIGLGGEAGSAAGFGGGVAYVDSRLPDLGVRLILPRATARLQKKTPGTRRGSTQWSPLQALTLSSKVGPATTPVAQSQETR